MASVFTIFGEIALNADSANRTIDGTTQKAGGLAKTFNRLGAGAKVVGKTVVATSAAAAAAVGTLFKASAERYAEYEQLVGGVETLFKDSNTKVMQYANNAYKTAGLSANDYMQTVTSFSASLLQSLGGDTDKAADVADMALTDMADNANKMGTSMESIQNAYQGFAKQNYTMLDNLKLGYGGTKSEMQRLLKDASKLTGVKYDIKNLDDVYEAIHVIQTELGITGTTAKEATETIAGSWAALGSAWENMLIGMSDSEADMDVLMEHVFSSAETVAKNIGKLLPTFKKNLGKMLTSVAKWTGQKIKSGWENTVYPYIKDLFQTKFGITLPDWDSLKTTITKKWAEVTSAFESGGTSAVLQVLLPDQAETIAQITEWWSGSDSVYTKIKNTLTLTIEKVVLPASESVDATVQEWWTNTAQPKLSSICKGIMLEFLVPAAEDVYASVTDWWNNSVVPSVKSLLTLEFEIKPPDVAGTVENLKGFWRNLVEFYGSMNQEYTPEETGSTDEWTIDTTAGATTPVKVVPTEESEGEMIETVAGYDLEGLAQIFADPNSETWLQAYLDSLNLRVPVTFDPTGDFNFDPDGEHKSGLDRVPFDGYKAILHKDEAVLRASEAAVWRREKSGGNVFGRRNVQLATDQPVTVNLTVNGVSSSPYEIAGEVRNALELLKWRG